MYFSVLEQGSKFQSPAKMPVVMATQPCWEPWGEILLSIFLCMPDLEAWRCFLHTWHSSVPVSKRHRISFCPHKFIHVVLIGEAQPEVFLWPQANQADKECIVHPGNVKRTFTALMFLLLLFFLSFFTHSTRQLNRSQKLRSQLWRR